MRNLCPQPDSTENRSTSCMNNSPVISQCNHTSMSVLTTSSTTAKAMSRKASPPIFMFVLGAAKFPLRRSFYTWAEGATPTVLFEFLSDSTADEDRGEKVHVYLRDMGAQEYFLHQPEMEKPVEFRGWRREPSGTIVEIPPDTRGALFSESLNLSFRWADQHHSHVRLLRPYLPDGTPITTAIEERNLHAAAKKRVEAAGTPCGGRTGPSRRSGSPGCRRDAPAAGIGT